jgi:predicted amidohydrolase YtcJ
MKHLLPILILLLAFSCQREATSNASVDLVLKNGKIWTGDESNPWANWIAVTNGKISALGQEGETPPAGREEIDLQGKLATPGFNDSHVHFGSAGALLLGINLLDVNDETLLRERLQETTERLPKGSWITRGDWGAYEAWGVGSDGSNTDKVAFTPHRNMIDDLTPDHPVLITRYDRGEGLANARALDYLGIESESGLLEGAVLREAMQKIPEKSRQRRMAETVRALEECRKYGVTTVQDMSRPEQLELYQSLNERGELTCRINFSPSELPAYKDMAEWGWVIDWDHPDGPRPAGDDMISFGTLKTHIDGIMGARTARFFQPYSDNILENASWRGGWREYSEDLGSFKDMILSADSVGIQLRIHAIGDQANSILLDILDTLDTYNGPKDRRFRIVHAQVISPGDFPRFQGRNVVAEVQPYHVTDDMRWMEERIGYERCKGAYAFRTLEQNGCILSFGSDWPGTNASYYPINPLMGIYAAVTRQTVNGEPAEGWFPDQRIPLEEALQAYTWGAAYGAFEEDRKGTLEVGKLADIAVLDTDLFETEPSQWLEAGFTHTILGGKIVYEKD